MRFPSTIAAALGGLVLAAFLTTARDDEGLLLPHGHPIVIPHDASDDVHFEAELTDETIRPEVVVTIGPRELVRPHDAMPFVMDASLPTLRQDAKTWSFYHSVVYA